MSRPIEYFLLMYILLSKYILESTDVVSHDALHIDIRWRIMIRLTNTAAVLPNASYDDPMASHVLDQHLVDCH